MTLQNGLNQGRSDILKKGALYVGHQMVDEENFRFQMV